MIAMVGYETTVQIKYLDAISWKNFEQQINPVQITDYDLKLVARRVELTSTIEMIDNKALVYYPSRRSNFRDGSCTMELPLLLPEHNTTNQTAEFLANIISGTNGSSNNPETIYFGRWVFYVYFNGEFVNRTSSNYRQLETLGLFVVSNATINITESGTPTSTISGNIIYYPVFSSNISV